MASNKPPPLLGYNTNVRHSGQLFHIQTEDSGVDHPHIITHLFVEGTILATKKRSYDTLLEKSDWDERVRAMMKEQHKEMFVELRDGVHDEIAAKIFATMGNAQIGSEAPPSIPPERISEAPIIDIDAQEGVRVIRPAVMNAAKSGEAPQESQKITVVVETTAGKSIFDTPSENGEFGEALITNKSLDEVILSYLTDELDD